MPSEEKALNIENKYILGERSTQHSKLCGILLQRTNLVETRCQHGTLLQKDKSLKKRKHEDIHLSHCREKSRKKRDPHAFI